MNEKQKALNVNAVRLDIIKLIQEEQAKYSPNNDYMRGAIAMAVQIEKLIRGGLIKQ
jgi:hypothetical protein